MYQEEPANAPCGVFMIMATRRLISVDGFQRRLSSHSTVYVCPSVVASRRHPERKQSTAERYSKGTRTLWELLRPAQDQCCK